MQERIAKILYEMGREYRRSCFSAKASRKVGLRTQCSCILVIDEVLTWKNHQKHLAGKRK
jgi:hypothetical protein